MKAESVSSSFYSKLLYLWSVVFCVVGLLFLVVPDRVGAVLTLIGQTLFLDGMISMPRDNVGYVLALSLMSVITVISYGSARRPEETLIYRALLLGKLVSTVLFALLAWTVASVWIVCAVTDGFVALTLVFARSLFNRERGLSLSYQKKSRGQSPFYEVWFGKVDLGRGKAFWFRYSLLNGVRKEAALWAIFFDGETIHAGKSLVPLDALEGDLCDVFRVTDGRLSQKDALGKAGPLSWDLKWQDSGRRFSHGPSCLKKLGLLRNRYESSFLDLRFSGTIRLSSGQDIAIPVTSAPGMIGHIWGEKHAHHWAWVHCNQFKDAPGVLFEGLSAQLLVCGQETRPLSSFVLYLDQQCYELNSIKLAIRSQSTIGARAWSFVIDQGDLHISGEASLPEKTAVVEYTDTDDARLFCYNSKLASLKLHVIDRARGIDRVLEARETAAFECVNRLAPTEDITI